MKEYTVVDESYYESIGSKLNRLAKEGWTLHTYTWMEKRGRGQAIMERDLPDSTADTHSAFSDEVTDEEREWAARIMARVDRYDLEPGI